MYSIGRYPEHIIFCIMWQSGGSSCLPKANTPIGRGSDFPTFLEAAFLMTKNVL